MREGEPRHYGFLLTPNFTLIAFSSAVEVLRMANRSSEQELYKWSVLTLDNQPVACSAALEIQPNCLFDKAKELDTLFVCAGINVRNNWSDQLGTELRRLAAANVSLGALCTATYLLARSGVLDDRRCTVHWEHLSSLREEFPRLIVKDDIFAIDRKRYTAAGGTAPLDLMLYLVSRDYGREVAWAISEQFAVERIRDLDDPQEVSVRSHSPGAPDYFCDAVQLMKHNVSERLFVEEIARYLKVSTRQLERAFLRYFNTSPSQYYLRVRLQEARNLLRYSSDTVRSIAIDTGFKSVQHFSKCYFDHFNARPTQERGQ